MFKTLRFLLVAIIIALSLAWLLDNNGSITIHWLGYEARTDIMTAILLMIFFAALIFVTTYISTKIFSIKLPEFLHKLKNKKHEQ